jgi:holo-[acyl-carrier protein] synthase
MLTPGLPPSVLRVGLDLIEVERFRAFLYCHQRRLHRMFTEQERVYCQSRPDPAPSYAARFCAKEAAMKALGVGWPELPFTDIEVVFPDGGRPRLRLHGQAQRAAGQLHLVPKDLSLTHAETIAAAMVVLVEE